MSRTDQHRPWWTRLSDKGLAVEEHDHTRSPCDLPTLKEWVHLLSTAPDSLKQRNCSWTMSNSAWATNPSCGCKMCTQQDYRKIQRRKSRRANHNQAHTSLRENRNAYPDEVDGE